MIKENVYKPVIKNFMGIANVRVIEAGREEYVVCKDMFDCLGLVDDNGIWSKPKQKMIEFLDKMDKICDWKTFPVTSKSNKSKSRDIQEVECLNIETAPIVLTQFKPTARRGEDALDRWYSFMKFVSMLLEYHEVHKYIFSDKDKQKQSMDEIVELGGQPVIANQMINKIMGELILHNQEDKFPITKDMLKIYQPQTTIDLLEVRNYVMERFKTAFDITNSHKESYDLALKASIRKYKDMI